MSKEYTMDDPEYWVLFAKTIGNPDPEMEDFSNIIDEDGFVIADKAEDSTGQPD